MFIGKREEGSQEMVGFYFPECLFSQNKPFKQHHNDGCEECGTRTHYVFSDVSLED